MVEGDGQRSTVRSKVRSGVDVWLGFACELRLDRVRVWVGSSSHPSFKLGFDPGCLSVQVHTQHSGSSSVSLRVENQGVEAQGLV